MDSLTKQPVGNFAYRVPAARQLSTTYFLSKLGIIVQCTQILYADYPSVLLKTAPAAEQWIKTAPAPEQ